VRPGNRDDAFAREAPLLPLHILGNRARGASFIGVMLTMGALLTATSH